MKIFKKIIGGLIMLLAIPFVCVGISFYTKEDPLQAFYMMLGGEIIALVICVAFYFAAKLIKGE